MAEEEELIEEPKGADVEVKAPPEPEVPAEPEEAGAGKKMSASSFMKGTKALPDILKGIPSIRKEGPGVPEDKNEPHTHLFLLLTLVIVLGVIISFTGI